MLKNFQNKNKFEVFRLQGWINNIFNTQKSKVYGLETVGSSLSISIVSTINTKM